MNGDQMNPTNPAAGAAAPTPSGGNQKPAVIEKIKGAKSILVAVSANPSIDQLAAAIALTLLLEKYKKNATAVFSGKVPAALQFLKPGEHFQTTTDSLRDFIIAIDKSKADKLRYKVEDNVVKIFITPYKTSITEKDLQYNAGDFNVDVIIALGVAHEADIDTAISAHGRIFHDAVVVGINNIAGGDFGAANWEDFGASSLSELIAHLATDLGPNMIDADIATALLTGIVAETSRFSNAKTHPETMNVSSLLLQAGADQQLVNRQLQSIISTDVSLQAGTEIKPTMTAEEQAKEFNHEEEELVISDDGSLKPVTDEPFVPQLDKPNVQETVSPEEVPAEAVVAPVDPLPEPDLVLTGADKVNEAPAGDDALDNSDDPDDAEAARNAVTDALKNAAAESDTIPAINVVEPPATGTNAAAESDPVASQPELGIAPPREPFTAAPNFGAPAADPQAPSLPSFEPTAPAADTVPPIGAEPAPLSMSPADQAFTMPLPPTTAIDQPVATPQSASQPTDDPVNLPPPLPPPFPPAQ